jgi:transposase
MTTKNYMLWDGRVLTKEEAENLRFSVHLKKQGNPYYKVVRIEDVDQSRWMNIRRIIVEDVDGNFWASFFSEGLTEYQNDEGYHEVYRDPRDGVEYVTFHPVYPKPVTHIEYVDKDDLDD